MFEILMVIISVCVLVAFCSFSISTKEKGNCELIDIDTSRCLKGFAILLVFVHHFGQLSSDFYNNHSFLGYLGVTIFLFISGYVTEKQLIKKGRSYVGVIFIKKKAVRLYLPYLLCILLFAVVGRHGFQQMVREILNVKGDWFLSSITLFFFFFMIVNQFGIIQH